MSTSATGFAVSVRAALVASAAVGLVLPAVAFAQNAQPAADAGNEIIVTATKREQTLQSIPVAVSVTTAATIQQAQIRDIKDLSSVVPSLRVTASSRPRNRRRISRASFRCRSAFFSRR